MPDQHVIARLHANTNEEPLIRVTSYPLAVKKLARLRKRDPQHTYILRKVGTGENLNHVPTLSDLVVKA